MWKYWNSSEGDFLGKVGVFDIFVWNLVWRNVFLWLFQKRTKKKSQHLSHIRYTLCHIKQEHFSIWCSANSFPFQQFWIGIQFFRNSFFSFQSYSLFLCVVFFFTYLSFCVAYFIRLCSALSSFHLVFSCCCFCFLI